MRKTILLLVLMFCLYFPALKADAADIKVLVDGRELKVTTNPTIINGKLMVPMRSIFEALGAKVDWDRGYIVATLGQHEIKLRENDGNALKNGRKLLMPVPAKIINGVTMVPLRFVGEALDTEVDWANDFQTVLVTSAQFKEYEKSTEREKVDRYKKYAKVRNLLLTYEKNIAHYNTFSNQCNQVHYKLGEVTNDLFAKIEAKDQDIVSFTKKYQDKLVENKELIEKSISIGLTSIQTKSIAERVDLSYKELNVMCKIIITEEEAGSAALSKVKYIKEINDKNIYELNSLKNLLSNNREEVAKLLTQL